MPCWENNWCISTGTAKMSTRAHMIHHVTVLQCSENLKFKMLDCLDGNLGGHYDQHHNCVHNHCRVVPFNASAVLTASLKSSSLTTIIASINNMPVCCSVVCVFPVIMNQALYCAGENYALIWKVSLLWYYYYIKHD